jgi:hypothetical protein
MVNGTPQWPTRSWRKNTGPELVARTAIARPIRTGARKQQPEGGRGAVEAAFGEPAETGQFGALHVQPGQAGDRPDVHPRADDVGDRRRHQQLRVGVLELPAEAAQGRAVQLLAGQHRDGVHLEAGDHLGDVFQPAEHR